MICRHFLDLCWKSFIVSNRRQILRSWCHTTHSLAPTVATIDSAEQDHTTTTTSSVMLRGDKAKDNEIMYPLTAATRAYALEYKKEGASLQKDNKIC